MNHKENWDWQPGRRTIADLAAWRETYDYMEEVAFSPDGESAATIVKTPDAEFAVCQNGQLWENVFDKAWYLRYAPDGRLCAIVSDAGEWTLAIDGDTWESRVDYLYDLRFAPAGPGIAGAAQQGGTYRVVRDDMPWEADFPTLTDTAISPDGSRSAAVVQTVTFKEGDIFTFQKGCFALAVDGKVQNANFLNVWNPVFSHDARQVAAEVRTSLYDYTITVDGTPWPKMFSAVWGPQFNPATGKVSAPVKTPEGWTIAEDGAPIWTRPFSMIHRHLYSPSGNKLAAEASPVYGRWTMAVDGIPWALTFGDLVADPVFSPDGERLACIGKDNGRWYVAVDGKRWPEAYEMVLDIAFSPDGGTVAARVEKDGRRVIVVNEKPIGEAFLELASPGFSEDGRHLLLRGVCDLDGRPTVVREVLPTSDIR